MPFEIVRGDITEFQADAIVNTANPMPVVGYGVDAGIHAKAGPKLLAARKRIGAIAEGCAAITRGYDLSARYVIHAVSPAWKGGDAGEEEALRRTYDSALKLAARHRCKSVAFPLLATGHYGFPKPLALQIAVNAFSAFLMDHEMQITLVVFDRTSFQLSGNLVKDVESYIDENYVKSKLNQEFHLPEDAEDELWHRLMNQRRMSEIEARERYRTKREEVFYGSMPMKAPEPEKPEEPEEEDLEEDAGAPRDFGTLHAASRIEPPARLPAPDAEHTPAPPAAPSRPLGAPPAPREASKPATQKASFPMFTGFRGKETTAAAPSPEQDISQLLAGMKDGFSPTLLHMIDRSGRTDADVYKHANVDRRLFSKIRSNPQYNPSKTLVLAFAISLKLDLDDTKYLLETAGFALSNSNITDTVVAYCIRHNIYDIYQVNSLLFQFDGMLLGSVREVKEA